MSQRALDEALGLFQLRPADSLEGWLILMKDGIERCFVCQEPLLRAPVFWIDAHKDGVHLACEEQYLTEREIDAALQWEAGFG